MSRFVATFVLLFACAFAALAGDTGLPDGITDTQSPKDHTLTPAESLAKITLPTGFEATLFAGEPDVRQPISMTIDDRGRLWICESYAYTSGKYLEANADSILIMEDTDGDGHCDSRKVFWDKGRILTSALPGFGGVYALNEGQLIFFADRNGDDKPDGPPQVLLDGFEHEKIAHNIVNGLMWGPDGWLYGRHGITATSSVGAPGTPDDQRTMLNCSIWRYHPTRHVFEVVTNGTTNPWGLDYDDYGQMFFINTVIGHLWHVIPGAHYKRMFGQDFNLYLYDLIDQHADHYHWDNSKGLDSRNMTPLDYELGGGHSHCGAMIYLGDNWPQEYRGALFMHNTHGRRINMDTLVREGSGYVGKHGKDFMFANDDWFKGVDLTYGPDGGVFITDWHDLGECHDGDGVHRSSGRIYKIMYTASAPPKTVPVDLTKLSDAELVKLQLHRNDWYCRHARRILQERSLDASHDVNPATAALFEVLDHNPDVTRRLRALWTLYAMDEVNESHALALLDDKSEHMRAWGIKLLRDDTSQPASEKALKRFAEMAKGDPSAFIRLHLASALQRIELDQRWPIAAALVQHEEDADDPNLPLMYWYGIEPLVPANKQRALDLAVKAKIPLVRELIARRVASLTE